MKSFLEAAESRNLERILELDLDWKPVRLDAGRLHPVLSRERRPACRLFRRGRSWLASYGLGRGSAALRECSNSEERGRVLLSLGRSQEAFQEFSSKPKNFLRGAEVALSFGDYARASALLDKGVKANPEDPWTLAWRAEARWAGGDRGGACSDMDHALALAPDDGDLLVLSSRLGRPQNLDRAVALAKDPFWALLHRAWFYLDERRPARAMKDLDAVVSDNPFCAWAWFWRALARDAAGDAKGAKKDRELAIRLDPAAIWSYSSLAKKIGVVTDWSEVLADCQARIEANPKDAVAHALRAECRDQHELVSADHCRAIDLEPERAWFHALAARVLVYKGETEAGLRAIEKAIALEPDCGWFYSWRGEIHRRRKDHVAGMKDQTRAIVLNGEDSRAYAWRGCLRLETGDINGALKDFDCSLELDSEYASWVLNQRSQVLSMLGDNRGAEEDFYQAARRDFRMGYGKKPLHSLALLRRAERSSRLDTIERCLKLDPWLAWGYALRAKLRAERGQALTAAEDLRVFKALSIKDCGASLFRAMLLRRGGKAQESIEICARLLALNPADAWTYQERALARWALGDNDGAFADQRQAQRLEAGMPWVFGLENRPLLTLNNRLEWAISELQDFSVWRGYLYLLAGDEKRAQKILRRNNGAWARAWLGELALRQGRFKDAASLLKQSLGRKDGDRAWIWALWGESLSRLNRGDEAIKAFEKSLALDPGEKISLLGRARLLQDRGLHKEALADLDAALSLEPQAASLRYWRAEILLFQERPAEAEIELSRAIAIHSEYAEAIYLRGEIRRRLGRLLEALPDLNRAIELNSQRAEFFVSRGLVLREHGRFKEQLQDCAKAAALDTERFGALSI